MWLKKIQKIFENEKYSYLDNRNDLHFAIFITELFKNKINFKIKDKKLIIQKDDKEIPEDLFFYWLQIIFYKEIQEEEIKLIQSFEKIKMTIQKLKDSFPINNEEEETEKQIFEINVKINKLTNHLKKEEPKLKENIRLLTGIRNSFYTRENFNKLLNSILLILKYSKSGL